jgi:catechol-2,3-dioxygenase
MISVKRLGHVALKTPDVQRVTEYYLAVFGLGVVGQDAGRTVLATRLGLETVVIERGPAAELGAIGLQIAPGTDLDLVERELAKRQIAYETRSDITPGVAKAIVFRDVYGSQIELFADYRFSAAGQPSGGIDPIKLGHVARFVDSARAGERFYTETLGFRVSDWRTTVSVFMRCGPDHHTINVFEGEPRGLAHIAFEVKDFSELQRACDVLAGHRMKLDWGPSRHVIGHNISCYHQSPDGLRIEVYTEMDQMKDESLGYFEPRPWHEDMPQRPKVWPLDTSRNYWGSWGH